MCNGEPVCPAGCFEDGPACETCVSGCFCDSGLMEFGDICVPPDLCVPVDPGALYMYMYIFTCTCLDLSLVILMSGLCVHVRVFF